jgi:hypothetical protein
MKKHSKTKLSLRSEAIRHLGATELAVAQGGMPPQTRTQCAGDCDTYKCATEPCVTTHHLAC